MMSIASAAFRDFQVAAPLKPAVHVDRNALSDSFRDFQVAAPLKRCPGPGCQVGQSPFPRLPSRGPIEAVACYNFLPDDFFSATSKSRPH